MMIKNYVILFWEIFDFSKNNESITLKVYRPYFSWKRKFKKSGRSIPFYSWNIFLGYIEIRKMNVAS